MNRFVLFLTAAVSLVAGCSRTPTAQEITGHWRLVDVYGRTPQEVGFKEFTMDFEADGTWSFDSSMTEAGKLGLGGSGTWSVSGDKLHCKTESRDATIGVSMRGEKLILEPDPVIEPFQGTQRIPVITTYAR